MLVESELIERNMGREGAAEWNGLLSLCLGAQLCVRCVVVQFGEKRRRCVLAEYNDDDDEDV